MKDTRNVPEIPSGNDIDKLDPIAMLLANQKGLSLSQETQGKLANMDAELMRATKPSLAIIDSLRFALKAASESPDSRGAIRQTMAAYERAVSDIRKAHDDGSRRALDLLTDDPRKAAEKLIQGRREEFDKATKTRRPDSP